MRNVVSVPCELCVLFEVMSHPIGETEEDSEYPVVSLKFIAGGFAETLFGEPIRSFALFEYRCYAVVLI